MTSSEKSLRSAPFCPLGSLEQFCRGVLEGAGASAATADAATRAMMHGTRLGVDSHGVRLLAHYVTVLESGRVNPAPRLRFVNEVGAVASLDADNAHGALATYKAMERATSLAKSFGIGAVAIRNSSHFGPAGAYALSAAEAGFLGLATCNSDSFVRLHGGAEKFHGTNPIALAVPSGGKDPWLFDMATSATTYNRVLLHRSTGASLPEGVASTPDGTDTRDPTAVDMLAPLGGTFGYKGAGLAGLAEILSAAFTGMRFSTEILPMAGPDLSSPREMGAFVMAMDPAAFVANDTFSSAMDGYLHGLRSSPYRIDETVMAPGDREWAVRDQRERDGAPLDPATERAFRALSDRYGIALPFSP